MILLKFRNGIFNRSDFLSYYRIKCVDIMNQENNSEFHLADYLNIIWKRKWVVITFFLFVVCIVAVKTYTTTPIYSATTRIIFEGKSEVIDLANVQAISKRKGYQETLLELLKSKGLANTLLNDQKYRDALVSNKEQPDYLAKKFKDIKKISSKTLDKVISYFTSSSPGIPNTRSKPLEGHAERVLKKTDPLVGYYLGKLLITPIPDTFLVDISFENRSPELAAHIVNTHVNAFIVNSKQLQQETSQNALIWLKKRLREHKVKVEESQRALKKYTYQQLESLSIDDEHLFTLPEIKELYAFNTLRKDLVKLKAQKIEMSAKYGPKHPKVIEVNSSIKQFEQKVKEELDRLKGSIKMELDLAAKKDIKPQEAQEQVAVFGDTANSSYGMLELEAESDKEIYDILIKQAKEINLTGNMEDHNIRIIDKAEIPRRPIKPNVFMNILLSIVLGLAFGVGFAFFVEYMDKTTIKAPGDIMQHSGMSIVGTLPYDKSLKRNKPLVLPLKGPHNKQKKLTANLPLKASHHKQKKLAKGRGQYNNFTANLIGGLPLIQSGMSGQTLLFSSTTAGEGKTTVLSKSAIDLARGGLRVVMVDADMQRSSLHSRFGLENDGKSGLTIAMLNILSKKIKEGSLNELSVSDIFSLITLRKQSGKLVISNCNSCMNIVFGNGRLLYLESQDTSHRNRLGTMLLHGGFITESQLKDALARNKSTGQPLGYILINAGYITQDKLQGPVKLQMEEHLHKLFSWKQGTFNFESGHIETYEDNRIYFQEDYTPIINRLSCLAGNRFLEREVFSNLKAVSGLDLYLFPAGMESVISHTPAYYSLLAKFLDILKQRFDVVLLDGPPLLETMGFSSPLISLSDNVIFITKSGNITVKNFKESINNIKKAKGNIMGIILNQGKKSSSDYYYS